MTEPSRTVRGVVRAAALDFLGSWRSLVLTDLAYKVIAFALLGPATTLLLRALRSGTDVRAVADTEILTFFVTRPVGILTLVVGLSLMLAITALESACLMGIGLSAAQGRRLDTRSALAFGAMHAPNVLRLAAHMTLRLIVGLSPFLLAAGLVYWALLRRYDINYYLSGHPFEFWTAVALVAVVVAALAALLVHTAARWALALPLLLFEHVHPRRALGESARRSQGGRALILTVLAAGAVLGFGLVSGASWLVETAGRGLAPHFSGSLALLLLFISGLVILWAAQGLAVAVVNISLLSLLLTRLYLAVGGPRDPRAPRPWSPGREGRAWHLSGRATAGLAAVTVLAAVGVALFAFRVTRDNREVLVIAHRGASAEAPENTLAAFRLAVEQGADVIELDVQESADGEVVVVHDRDLMKLAGAPLEIWNTPAAELREIDIGSHAGAQFSAERVPTLDEALAVAKGRARVIVELKSYGHDERLEERVAAIVEAAGMEDDCTFMSLDHEMVARMKELRPAWRSGLLVAKALGDLTVLRADFLAVEARMASRRFVRRAHRAGKDVYVWTLNDPAWMLAAMSRGVDGLITDRPELARRVVRRRAELSDSQRLLVALLVRLGARTESLAAEDALRP